MYSFYKCPKCNNNAERDLEDARLGAVSGGAFSLDTKTGLVNGESHAAYHYRCAACDIEFTVHRSIIISNGTTNNNDYVEIEKEL